jgi:hypothetical protein
VALREGVKTSLVNRTNPALSNGTSGKAPETNTRNQHPALLHSPLIKRLTNEDKPMFFKSALKLAAIASLVATTTVSTSAHAWFNTTNVNQFGSGHAVGGAQVGAFNHMEFYQDGWGNTSIATQDGFGNETVVGQSGIGNTATSNQTGACNISGIAQFGFGNTATADQVGDCNAQAVIQMGTGNSVNTTQVGSDNVAVIIQY